MEEAKTRAICAYLSLPSCFEFSYFHPKISIVFLKIFLWNFWTYTVKIVLFLTLFSFFRQYCDRIVLVLALPDTFIVFGIILLSQANSTYSALHISMLLLTNYKYCFLKMTHMFPHNTSNTLHRDRHWSKLFSKKKTWRYADAVTPRGLWPDPRFRCYYNFL